MKYIFIFKHEIYKTWNNLGNISTFAFLKCTPIHFLSQTPWMYKAILKMQVPVWLANQIVQ